MAHNNFRIEPVAGTEIKKIYKKNNDNLPIKINCNTRYFTVLPLYEKYLEDIFNFEVRSDDIWVITQPKNGTTWMLELVWLLQNNCDFETALKIEQEERIPFLELSTLIPIEKPNSIEVVANTPSPRIIKSHLPIHLLPKQLWTVKPKIIYVARDPKDAMVSYYHHHYLLGVFRGSLNEYLTLTMNDKLRSCPLGVTSFEFWQLRDLPYIFFTSFERMKKDLRSVILKLSSFLQKDVKEEQMAKLLDHLSFQSMKDNRKCNHLSETKLFQDHFDVGPSQNNSRFVRKGEVNSYKTELSDEMKHELEKWNLNQMKTYGINAEEMLLS